MNENFFNLKKDRQDKIINAALKVFATDPYQYASTDRIVKEASISKGLLFHYFISKIGLYSFLYDYCVRYITLEIGSIVDKNEKNFFQIRKQIISAEAEAMRNYKYCMMFIYMAGKEQSNEAVEAIAERKAAFEMTINETMSAADTVVLAEKSDQLKIGNMINYTLQGLMEDMFRQGTLNPDNYLNEAVVYLNMIERLS